MIFAEGEPGDTLYIVQSGTVKIGKIAGGEELVFAVDKPGDMFGEMALLDHSPRSAGAIANENCVLTAVNEQGFEALAKAQPALMMRVMKTLAERIWFMDKQYANTHLTDPAGRMFDGIVMHFEKERAELGKPHVFNFGLADLAKMIGIPENAAAATIAKVKENKALSDNAGKLTVLDINDIRRERDFYRSVQRRADIIKKNKEQS
jgi:CRP-like cAMP-binding protein